MSTCGDWLYAEPAQKSNRPKGRSREVTLQFMCTNIIGSKGRREIFSAFQLSGLCWNYSDMLSWHENYMRQYTSQCAQQDLACQLLFPSLQYNMDNAIKRRHPLWCL